VTAAEVRSNGEQCTGAAVVQNKISGNQPTDGHNTVQKYTRAGGGKCYLYHTRPLFLVHWCTPVLEYIPTTLSNPHSTEAKMPSRRSVTVTTPSIRARRSLSSSVSRMPTAPEPSSANRTPSHPPLDQPLDQPRDGYPTWNQTSAPVSPMSLFWFGATSALVVTLMYFPHKNAQVEQLMHWRWFRVAWLLLVLLLAARFLGPHSAAAHGNTSTTRTVCMSFAATFQCLTVLFASVLFVVASNVTNVRRGSVTSEVM